MNSVGTALSSVCVSVTMKPKHLCILLLAVVAVGTVAGQNEDIPIENDNQFPPENPEDSDGAIIEGSGDGTVEEPPVVAAETTPIPLLEEMQPTVLQGEIANSSEDSSCPKPCVCHLEGGTENFVVDCSGYELTEIPSPIDPRTTTLNIQNNKISEIPKDLNVLKNLKVLNAENNYIMDLALGSVSELPELTVLKLAKNRLIEYPKDLKNSLSLTKLEELDLGGNDMRTELKAETFSNFPALKKLTLPVYSPGLLQELCATLKDSMHTVCTESCDIHTFECEDAIQEIDDDLLDATLPGMIPFEGNDDADPSINSANVDVAGITSDTTDTRQEPAANSDSLVNGETTDEPSVEKENVVPTASGRSIVNKEQEEITAQKADNVVDAPKDDTTKSETDSVKVGATTTETQTGGVDKSVIGMIVAGMVVVVAGITIKKNWSSIRKRFSSSPRPAERAGANANGTSPEEVPLQDKDKSPV